MKTPLRNSTRNRAPLRKHVWLLAAVTVLLAGVGCAKKKPVSVVYINRPMDLGPAAAQAVAQAKNEVTKWDFGTEIVDYRVQRHSNGHTVSLLIAGTFDNEGNPVYGKTPIRNVEVDQNGDVVGYHISH
jgi:hypothetical protein